MNGGGVTRARGPEPLQNEEEKMARRYRSLVPRRTGEAYAPRRRTG